MTANWLLRTGIVVLLGFAAVAPARAAMPDSELTKLTDEDDTFTSPDGQIVIEQYWKDKSEYDRVYAQFIGPSTPSIEHGVLLNPGEGLDVAGYPAGFRFSSNSRWVVRMQKIGSGTHTLFLYRRNGTDFVGRRAKTAGRDGLGLLLQPADIAEDPSKIRGPPFDQSRPDQSAARRPRQLRLGGQEMARQPLPRAESVVRRAGRGQEALPWVEDWQVVFDTKTGQVLDPTTDLAKNNAETINYPAPKRR